MKLDGKIFAVTGAGAGIGRQLAGSLVAGGSRVIGLDINEDGLGQTAEQINNNNFFPVCCDVSCEQSVTDAFATGLDRFSVLHGLINNAGIVSNSALVKVLPDKTISRMSTQAFDTVMNVNLRGAFLCAREAVTWMLDSSVEEGILINISSGSRHGLRHQSNYSASKAGLVAMANVWALELAQHNIRAVSIAPGIIQTDILATFSSEKIKKMRTGNLVNRIGQPANVAQLVIHVIENDFINATVVEVDGGI